jgi:hypothetical protein
MVNRGEAAVAAATLAGSAATETAPRGETTFARVRRTKKLAATSGLPANDVHFCKLQ